VCRVLHAALARAFPEAYAARAAEAEAAEAAAGTATERTPELGPPRPPLASDFGCAACGRLLASPVVLNCGCCVCRSCLPPSRACTSCGAAGVVATPRVCGLVERTIAALFPAEAGKAARAASAEARPAEALPPPPAAPEAPPPAPAEPDHLFYGIGCDACGQYPVRNRRYRCLDCAATTRVGYDLCGACFDAGLHRIARFGQAHAPEHAMVEEPRRATALHQMAAAHPELTVEQVVGLAQMAMAADDDSDRVGDGAGDPLANPATVASAVELNFDELGPDFPPALRSVPALEAFFARVERLGPGGVDAETRGILVRFFPDVWSFLREHAPRDGGGGRLQLGGQGGEEQAGGGGGGEEGGGGDGGGGGGGDDASLAAEPAPPG